MKTLRALLLATALISPLPASAAPSGYWLAVVFQCCGEPRWYYDNTQNFLRDDKGQILTTNTGDELTADSGNTRIVYATLDECRARGAEIMKPEAGGANIETTACLVADTVTTGDAFVRRDNLIVLRTWANPTNNGRMLSLTASPSDDHTTLNLRAFATDDNDPVVGIILVGNPTTPFAGNVDATRIIARCPVTPADRPDVCNFNWPVSAMIPGNNVVQFVTTHKSGARWQIPSAFARPAPPA